MTPALPIERRARTRALASVVFAAFVVGLGYGVALPAWPVIVAELAGTSDPLVIARHTALLTGLYVAAPVLAAMPWAWLSKRAGRRLVIGLGLLGFALTLAASPFAPSLWALYAGRLLNGVFGAAIVPAALAVIGAEQDRSRRHVRSFSSISMATILGYLVGPVLGGVAFGVAGALNGAAALAAPYWPFVIGAIIALVALVFVWRYLPRADRARATSTAGVLTRSDRQTEALLLFLAAMGAAGLGVFEVGLTLRGRELAMTALAFGSMFALCSLAMLIAQALVFSPLVPPATTRWLIAPGFAAMALGLTVVPQASGLTAMLAETGLVATAAGFLTPVLAYWTSSVAGESQDAAFGRQNVAVSGGQAIGSVGAGLLFGVTSIPHAPFLLAAVGLGVAALASLTLPGGLRRYAAEAVESRVAGGRK